LCWTSYLFAELVHVSGVIATVVTGLVASWNQHTVLSASIRMRGSSFWGVMIFLMEAAVFILIGLSLRGVLARGGGFEEMVASMGIPILATLLALTGARIIWVFASEAILALAGSLKLTTLKPLGFGCATVLSWAGMRGVVTLALALSIPEGFPGRDMILVVSFAVILGTVVIQGTTLGLVIQWAKLSEPEAEKPPLTMSMAEAAMARVQLELVKERAYDDEGALIHPRLLQQYERKAVMTVHYAERTEYYEPMLHAHFDVVLEAIARGRQELLRLHREGKIDDEIMDELERDLDLEELKAISAKS
jgi:CPA1 family monovalent cation:H+ antiporter